MNKPLTPAVGEPSQMYILSAADLESVVRKLINEEADRRKAEEESRMMTTSEVARRLNVDPSTLYRWRKTGRLIGARVGKEYLYREQDVNRQLKGGRAL